MQSIKVVNSIVSIKEMTYIRFLAVTGFLFVGCTNKYKFTVKLCNSKLYSEVFNINPAGVDEDYLTDSLNFRVFVGKYDNKHENFSYVCKGDSIKIVKLIENTMAGKRKVDSIMLSLSDLRKKKMYNKKPLFEFK